MQQEAGLMIQRERARYIVRYLMTKRPRHSVYAWLGEQCKAVFGDMITLRQALAAVASVLLACGLWGPLAYHTVSRVILSALSLALGQVFLDFALLQSDWIGDIADFGEEVQAQHARPAGAAEVPRFLWICHQADYNERWCIANDPIDKGCIEKLATSMGEELEALRNDSLTLRGEVLSLRAQLTAAAATPPAPPAFPSVVANAPAVPPAPTPTAAPAVQAGPAPS
mmetsp:Transcript_149641/g.461997  ORF Transcript_149641/g.461997 Transcript_149641/m.461997 type:complete len:226 (-) Transcript_149641:33-710(-)